MDRESKATRIPHRTSIAVWDMPSPTVKGTVFTVTVGVTCAASYQLVRQLVIVRNQEDSAIGQGALEEGTWPGTTALYGTQVRLTAPTCEGVHRSAVETPMAFHSGQLHQCTQATLSYRTAKPPEHQVTITVSERDSGAPLEKAEVTLGLYRAMTDDQGRARLAVASGKRPTGVEARIRSTASDYLGERQRHGPDKRGRCPSKAQMLSRPGCDRPRRRSRP